MFSCNLLKNKMSYLALSVCCYILTTCLISSCGFTVRSKQTFPPQLHTIYFQADRPYGQLEVALKKKLKAARINVLDNANQAPLTFHLNQAIFSHSSDTKHGPSTQARIYHLTLATTFSISDAQGKLLFGPQNVESIRDLILNSNEIFDTSTEVDITKQTMRHELIIKIFNILSSQKVFQALQ